MKKLAMGVAFCAVLGAAASSAAQAAPTRTCSDALIGGKRWVVQSVHGLSCSEATSIVRIASTKVVPQSRKLGTISGLTCVSYAPVGKRATAMQCWTDNLSKQVNGALYSLVHP